MAYDAPPARAPRVRRFRPFTSSPAGQIRGIIQHLYSLLSGGDRNTHTPLGILLGIGRLQGRERYGTQRASGRVDAVQLSFTIDEATKRVGCLWYVLFQFQRSLDVL